jgi:hypothetical protein
LRSPTAFGTNLWDLRARDFPTEFWVGDIYIY